MLGTPVRRAAAQTEPQTGACRRKARTPSQTSVSAHVPKTSVCSLVCVEPHLKGMAAAWQPGGNRAHHRENGGWSCVAQGKACRRAEQSGSCRAPRYLRPSAVLQQCIKSCGSLLRVGGVTAWICSGDGAAGRSFILLPAVSWERRNSRIRGIIAGRRNPSQQVAAEGLKVKANSRSRQTAAAPVTSGFVMCDS